MGVGEHRSASGEHAVLARGCGCGILQLLDDRVVAGMGRVPLELDQVVPEFGGSVCLPPCPHLLHVRARAAPTELAGVLLHSRRATQSNRFV